MLIPIITKFIGTGVTQADRSFKALAKTTLLSTASLTGMAYALGRLTKAAMEDEKAQTALNKTLANAGWSKATESVNAYIAATQRATGVGDDELRPSFTSLFGALQDANAAMGAQALAMDIAAGTGRNLSDVSESLAKAFAGQRKGLTSLGTGLDAAFLKTADLNVVMDALASRYAGQAAAAAATTAGQFSILKDAAGEAGETIGSSLIESFVILAGGGNVQEAASAIDTFAASVGNLITKTATAGKTIWDNLLYPIFNLPKVINEALYGKTYTGGDLTIPGIDASVISGTLKNLKNQSALQKTLTKLEADRAKAAKAAAAKAAAAAAAAAAKARAAEAAKKKQATLDKAAAELSMKYDIERIGLGAAYAKETDAATRQRIVDLTTLNTLQYAENLGLKTMAEILASTMADLNKMVGIMGDLVTNQNAWTTAVNGTAGAYATLAERIKALASPSFNTSTLAGISAASQGLTTGAVSPNPIGNLTSANTNTLEGILAASAIPATPIGYAGTPSINVTVNAGNIVGQNDFNQAVADAMNQALRSGQSVPRLFSTL